jgi:hypothetical protein
MYYRRRVCMASSDFLPDCLRTWFGMKFKTVGVCEKLFIRMVLFEAKCWGGDNLAACVQCMSE